MRKPVIITFLLLLTALGSRGTVRSEIAPLKAEDYRIGRLRLEQPIDEVIRIYGRPSEIDETIVYAGKKNAAEWRRYYFEGIELEVNSASRKVFDISVSRNGLKTPRNIGVGSKKGEVTGRYGKGYPMGMSLLYEMYDPVGRRDYVLEFVIDHSRVLRMEMRYAWE